MIYDCFSYWDEDLLLELRLNILNKIVDYFVIVEGNKTWQNNQKKLRFKIEDFQKFEDKIIYVPVEDLPDGDDPYLRENHQRNCISRGLKNDIIDNGGWHFCNLKRPEDLLNKYKNLCETNDPYHFNEKIDDKYLNLEEIKKKIDLKTDIIGRDDNFKKIEIDESFPKYIIDNISRYKEWISD